MAAVTALAAVAAVAAVTAVAVVAAVAAAVVRQLPTTAAATLTASPMPLAWCG
jgi:hypothetical protein